MALYIKMPYIMAPYIIASYIIALFIALKFRLFSSIYTISLDEIHSSCQHKYHEITNSEINRIIDYAGRYYFY